MSHSQRARSVCDEIENLTGIRPAYPNSSRALQSLVESLPALRRQYPVDLDRFDIPSPRDIPDDILRAFREAKTSFQNTNTDFVFSTWRVVSNGRVVSDNTMTDSRARRILQQLPPGKEYTLRIKFVCKDDQSNWIYKDNQYAVRQSRNSSEIVVITRNSRPGILTGIDSLYYKQSYPESIVVYGLVGDPEPEPLPPMRTGDLNCVAKVVRDTLESAKRGSGLTPKRIQTIEKWEAKVHDTGATLADVANLESDLKIHLVVKSITGGTILDSDKYKSKCKNIDMIYHNGHAWNEDLHFPKDRRVVFYKPISKFDTSGKFWKVVEEVLTTNLTPLAVWLFGGSNSFTDINQFILSDGLVYRTKHDHRKIKQFLVSSFTNDYQDFGQADLEAGQYFSVTHVASVKARQLNNWEPTHYNFLADYRLSCVEHGCGGIWNKLDYDTTAVTCIDMKSCYPASMQGLGECKDYFARFGHPKHCMTRVSINGSLPNDIPTGIAEVIVFKFKEGIHPVIPAWYGRHFVENIWAPIPLLVFLLDRGVLQELKVRDAIISFECQTSLNWFPKDNKLGRIIIGKFTQGAKFDNKVLTRQLITSGGELHYLYQDCKKNGTLVGFDPCPLGRILTYHTGNVPQYAHLRSSMLGYAHINVLTMVLRFDPDDIVRLATDSLYVKNSAMFRLANVDSYVPKPYGNLPKQVCSCVKPHCTTCSKFDPNCKACQSLQICQDCIKAQKLDDSNDYSDSFVAPPPRLCNVCGVYTVCDRHPYCYDCKSYTCCIECGGRNYSNPWPTDEQVNPGQWRIKIGEILYPSYAPAIYKPLPKYLEHIADLLPGQNPPLVDPLILHKFSYLNGCGGSGKTTRAITVFKSRNVQVLTQKDKTPMTESGKPVKDLIVLTPTHRLAKEMRESHSVAAQTYHSFFKYSNGDWTPLRMGTKYIPKVVIWDEICTVGESKLKPFVEFLLKHNTQLVCCGDQGQPGPIEGDLPHQWLQSNADYYEEVTVDYRAKCPTLRELKQKIRNQPNEVQHKIMCEYLPDLLGFEVFMTKWQPTDLVLSSRNVVKSELTKILFDWHSKYFPRSPVPLLYRPANTRQQNIEVKIPGTDQYKNLVKNDIECVDLSAALEELKNPMSPWELGYATTIHSSQGLTLYNPQKVWIIDDRMSWSNLIYLVVSRVEYLTQLERVAFPERTAGSVGYVTAAADKIQNRITSKINICVTHDRKKKRNYSPLVTVSEVLALKASQNNKCARCNIPLLWDYPPNHPQQFSMDRIDNTKGHCSGNIRLTCLECNKLRGAGSL